MQSALPIGSLECPCEVKVIVPISYVGDYGEGPGDSASHREPLRVLSWAGLMQAEGSFSLGLKGPSQDVTVHVSLGPRPISRGCGRGVQFLIHSL